MRGFKLNYLGIPTQYFYTSSKDMKKRRGYLILEAILGMILISGLYLYSGVQKVESGLRQKAELLGQDMADIIHGIDKRIVLDNRLYTETDALGNVTNKDWTASWVGATGLQEMLREELVGRGNVPCGVPTFGWKPKFTENEDKSLIHCELTKQQLSALGFEVSAERIPSSLGNHILKSWGVTLFHSNPLEFDEYVRFYGDVIEGFKKNDVLRMSGQHKVYLVDRTTGNPIPQLADCINFGTSCGIKFEFVTSGSEYDNEDGELRKERAIMLDDLTFRVSAANPEYCFRPTTDALTGNNERVHCGFDFEVTNGKLGLSANEMNAAQFGLIYKELNTNTPIVTMCWAGDTDSDEATPCGLSVISSSGALAKAHLDYLHAAILYFDLLEMDGAIKIRETLDTSKGEYQNVSSYSSDGVTYEDEILNASSKSLKVIFDDSGITFDADNRDITVRSDNSLLDATATYLTSGTISFDVVSGGNDGSASLTRSTNQSVNLRDSYIEDKNRKTSKLATYSQVLDGVKIVGIDKVNSGVRVRKKKCPISESSGTATVRAVTWPEQGFYSDRVSARFDSGRCKLNTTSAWSVRYNGRSWSVAPRCEVNRSTKVLIKVQETSTSFTPKFGFDVIGRSGTGSDWVDGIPMVLMQSCDYTK